MTNREKKQIRSVHTCSDYKYLYLSMKLNTTKNLYVAHYRCFQNSKTVHHNNK